MFATFLNHWQCHGFLLRRLGYSRISMDLATAKDGMRTRAGIQEDLHVIIMWSLWCKYIPAITVMYSFLRVFWGQRSWCCSLPLLIRMCFFWMSLPTIWICNLDKMAQCGSVAPKRRSLLEFSVWPLFLQPKLLLQVLLCQAKLLIELIGNMHTTMQHWRRSNKPGSQTWEKIPKRNAIFMQLEGARKRFVESRKQDWPQTV